MPALIIIDMQQGMASPAVVTDIQVKGRGGRASGLLTG